jgi:hypothetical protein
MRTKAIANRRGVAGARFLVRRKAVVEGVATARRTEPAIAVNVGSAAGKAECAFVIG